MSEKEDDKAELLFILYLFGLVIVTISIGALSTPPWGFLTFGVGLILLAWLSKFG